jgi:hypothetical protein
VEILKSFIKSLKIIPAASFEGLVDLVEDYGAPAFLVKENNELTVLSVVQRGGSALIPPLKTNIPYLLPRAEVVLDWYQRNKKLGNQKADAQLYEDLLTYHKNISELPGEAYYHLLVAWVFHTYLLESFKYSPIICLFAVPERGKTRTGQGLIYAGFRGIHLESLRDPFLVRAAHDLNASLFLDVRDIWKKAEQHHSEDILLHRFERGAKVPRVLHPDRGPHRDITYYSVFGPTIISTNESVHPILETRAIQINMPEARQEFDSEVTPEKGLVFRERLVEFRARHLGEKLQDIAKPTTSRLGDILKPLLQIIHLVKPEKTSLFLNLVKELEKERLVEKAESLEAQILKVVISLEDNVQNGLLAVKDITERLNQGKPERYQYTYHLIGRRLAALGFNKVRKSGGVYAIIWDKELLDRMKDAYGLKESPQSPL